MLALNKVRSPPDCTLMYMASKTISVYLEGSSLFRDVADIASTYGVFGSVHFCNSRQILGAVRARDQVVTFDLPRSLHDEELASKTISLEDVSSLAGSYALGLTVVHGLTLFETPDTNQVGNGTTDGMVICEAKAAFC